MSENKTTQEILSRLEVLEQGQTTDKENVEMADLIFSLGGVEKYMELLKENKN